MCTTDHSSSNRHRKRDFHKNHLWYCNYAKRIGLNSLSLIRKRGKKKRKKLGVGILWRNAEQDLGEVQRPNPGKGRRGVYKADTSNLRGAVQRPWRDGTLQRRKAISRWDAGGLNLATVKNAPAGNRRSHQDHKLRQGMNASAQSASNLEGSGKGEGTRTSFMHVANRRREKGDPRTGSGLAGHQGF